MSEKRIPHGFIRQEIVSAIGILNWAVPRQYEKSTKHSCPRYSSASSIIGGTVKSKQAREKLGRTGLTGELRFGSFPALLG
jgi:hypothetical protein